MADFCEKCGTPLDKRTGECPNCVAAGEAATKKKSRALPIALAVIIVIIAAAAAVIYFMVFGRYGTGVSGTAGATKGTMNTEDVTETADETVDLSSQYELPEFDADEYFENNTTLKDTVSVRSSKDILNERDVYAALEERGFAAEEAYYEYLLDGTLCDRTVISSHSNEAHPSYQLYYSSRHAAWLVSNINGDFFATLLSGDGTSERIIVSESDTVTSYDSISNKYYINIPDSSRATVRKVKTLDADELDKIAKEVNG